MYLRTQNDAFINDFVPMVVTICLLSLTVAYTLVANYDRLLEAMAHSEIMNATLEALDIKIAFTEKEYELALRPERNQVDTYEV